MQNNHIKQKLLTAGHMGNFHVDSFTCQSYVLNKGLALYGTFACGQQTRRSQADSVDHIENLFNGEV